MKSKGMQTSPSVTILWIPSHTSKLVSMKLVCVTREVTVHASVQRWHRTSEPAISMESLSRGVGKAFAVSRTGRKNRHACALKMATVKIQNGGQRIAFLHVTGDQFTTAHLSSRCVFWLNFELNSFTVRQASSDDNQIPFT